MADRSHSGPELLDIAHDGDGQDEPLACRIMDGAGISAEAGHDQFVRFSVACREGTELFLQGSVIGPAFSSQWRILVAHLRTPLRPSSFCWSAVSCGLASHWNVLVLSAWATAEIEMVVRQQTTIVVAATLRKVKKILLIISFLSEAV